MEESFTIYDHTAMARKSWFPDPHGQTSSSVTTGTRHSKIVSVEDQPLSGMTNRVTTPGLGGSSTHVNTAGLAGADSTSPSSPSRQARNNSYQSAHSRPSPAVADREISEKALPMPSPPNAAATQHIAVHDTVYPPDSVQLQPRPQHTGIAS